MNKKKKFVQSLKKAIVFDDTVRDYEVILTDIVKNNFDINIATEVLNEYVEGKQNENSKNIAYAAFYCVNIYHRNQSNNVLLDIVWDNYRDYFAEFKSFNHLSINRFLLNLDTCYDIEEQEIYLNKSFIDASNYTKNAGYQHAPAILFASIAEMNENNLEFRNILMKKWYDKSLRTINKAIEIDPNYAKYYCTRGRIYSANGNYDEADKQISLSITKENSERSDYAIRIGSYQYYRLQNQYRKQLNDIRVKIDEKQESIDKLNGAITSNIETIALFSAIVSFVLGSLKIANGESTVHAGLLIFILMGCLATVLTVFTMLLHLTDNRYSKKTAIYVIAVSIVISIGATILSGVF